MTEISVLIQHHTGTTGNVLVCKRPDGVWEFPHGTVRTNETDEAAAQRIAMEQLAMTISVGKLTLSGHKKPTDGTVEHIPCGNITHNTHTKCNWHNYYEAVNTWQTEPKSDVYTEFKWVHPSLLGTLEFAGDDVNFMAKYDPWVNGRFIPNVRMY